MPKDGIEPHSRAVINARNKKDLFVQYMQDVGIPFGSDWRKSPIVCRIVEMLKGRYEIVEVEIY